MFGEKEREIRAPLSASDSTIPERRLILEKLNNITIMMVGYLFALADVADQQTADYYEQFFEQARSAQGLPKGENPRHTDFAAEFSDEKEDDSES